MSILRCRLIPGLAVLMVGLATLSTSADESGIDTLPDKTYQHRGSGYQIKLNPGWEKVHEPFKIRPSSTTSVFGMEKNVGDKRANGDLPKVVVTVFITPMEGRPLSDIINASAKDDKLGEEYDILASVYTKEKVARPVIINVGPHKVHKVVIHAGPDMDLQGAGVMYIFEVGAGEKRWRIKVRGVYPIEKKDENMKIVEDVLKLFKPIADIK